MAVALITGTSSGIGKLTALELARRGHRVFASMRNLKSAKYIEANAQKEDLAIEIVQLDVTDPNSVSAAVESVLNRAWRIDFMVNNAGFYTFGPVEDYTDDEIKAVFETNLFGVIRTTRAVLPAMRAQRSGTIIIVSSISGLWTFPFNTIYSASKFALEAIGNGLRYELKQFGIRVVLIEPGNFNTRGGVNMHHPAGVKSGSAGTSDPLYATMIKNRQAARSTIQYGDANDVARAIADAAEAPKPEPRYLVGEDARLLASMTPAEIERRNYATIGLKSEQ